VPQGGRFALGDRRGGGTAAQSWRLGLLSAQGDSGLRIDNGDTAGLPLLFNPHYQYGPTVLVWERIIKTCQGPRMGALERWAERKIYKERFFLQDDGTSRSR